MIQGLVKVTRVTLIMPERKISLSAISVSCGNTKARNSCQVVFALSGGIINIIVGPMCNSCFVFGS